MRRSRNRDNYCYRHYLSESFVLCQRCGNTICLRCQIKGQVGFYCPDCARGGRSSKPWRLISNRITLNVRSDSPRVTVSLLTAMVLIYLAQWLSGGYVTQLLLYWPPLTLFEPWRMVTTIFVHSDSSVFHIFFNGYSLYVLGSLVERLVGPARFFSLFLLSGFGGSVLVLFLAPASAVVGASGAIFGLFGAIFVIQKSFGGPNIQLVIVLILNLIMGFIVPGVSWQAHIGGLLTGAVVANTLVKTRDKPVRLQRLRLGTIALGLTALSLVGAVV